MIEKKVHNVALSAFCSAMLLSSSAILPATNYQAAAVASGDVMAAKEIRALESFAKEGWHVSPEVSEISSPPPVAGAAHRTPAKVGVFESDELSRLSQYVLDNGVDYDFYAPWAKELGMTDDEKTPIPSKRIVVDGDPLYHHIYAIKRGDQVDVVFKVGINKERGFTETWVYRATLTGAYAGALHVKRFEEPHLAKMSEAEATPKLQEEKGYWFGRVPGSSVASQP